jgi:E3 ubiquitin-protein ligase TRIP12
MSMARNSSSSKASYAAALKTKPTDWHLEFSMDDHVLPLDLTIYGAIHQHEMRKKTGALPPSLIWQGVYTIKFKKVSGPLPSSDCTFMPLFLVGVYSTFVCLVARADGTENGTRNRSPSPGLSSLPEDAPPTKILRLLRVLYQLNALEAERSVFSGEKRNLPDAAFVNNKLTAKLTRQLEEPMIVARYGSLLSTNFLELKPVLSQFLPSRLGFRLATALSICFPLRYTLQFPAIYVIWLRPPHLEMAKSTGPCSRSFSSG